MEQNIMNDKALVKLVEESGLVPPQDRVEAEVRIMVAELNQEMKLGRDRQLFTDIMVNGIDSYVEEFRETATRMVKTEMVLDEIIKRENFPVSREELETEAQAMAKRLDMSMDVVRSFLGEDMGSLKKDLQIRKAMEYIHSLEKK